MLKIKSQDHEARNIMEKFNEEMKTESRHTPGPWSDEAYGKTSKGEIVIAGGNTADLIGEVYKCRDIKEQEANARLISAAPCMLKALKESLKIIEKQCLCEEGKPSDGQGSEFCDAWKSKKMLRSVINKAEGGGRDVKN